MTQNSQTASIQFSYARYQPANRCRQGVSHTLSAHTVIPDICRQIRIAYLLTRFVPGFPRRPFTAAQIFRSSPTASPLNVLHSFSTTLWLAASDTMPPALSDLIGRPSCTYLSQGHVQSMHMENYSKFSNSIKIFDTPVLHCGWHVCVGSALGQGSMRAYGMTCASHISPLNSVRLLTIYASQRSSQRTSMGTRGISRPRCPTPASDRSTLDQRTARKNNGVYWLH